MADATVVNGEVSDDRTVDIAGDETSSKISGLHQMIADLERENGITIKENEGYKKQIQELEASVEELSTANEDLKKQVEKAESENKRCGAARAAELEAEVSRLQHDLVSAMSDLQESTVELSDLKEGVGRAKEREKEKGVNLEAIGKERDLLLSKVEKLEGVENSLRGESDGKEREIWSLRKNVEELEGSVENSKSGEVEMLEKDH
ncbi:Peroxisomal and mitochondrial division factor 2 [Sesamum angolense]|uniref:Peroxisomal and mitochondrial division factor 2 n=1 Tax=Sesamum angolense TaxID=2727404 RepID=A0AAE2BUN7_9LAMI|nr:Peroxisomal and mitochondrial division factor 2 [Sesamum angolense]